MDILISAATHRSGSTLLQRIFNARKQTLIWGEHGGSLTGFVDIYEKVIQFSNSKDRETYFNSNENPNVWTANMTPSEEYVNKAIQNSVRALMSELFAQNLLGHDVIGFKEVRFGQREIQLFRACYPDAKIIFLVRNPFDTWRSMSGCDWYEETALSFANIWNNHASFYSNYYKNHHGCWLYKYEDIVGKTPKVLNELSELAGISIQTLDQVISVKIDSSSHSLMSWDDLEIIRTVCRSGMALLGYEEQIANPI